MVVVVAAIRIGAPSSTIPLAAGYTPVPKRDEAEISDTKTLL